MENKQSLPFQGKNLLVIFGAVGVLLITGVGFVYLGSTKPTYGPVKSSPTLTTAVPSPAQSSVAREITVTGSEYSFSPSSISVQAGERVKITFKNDGRLSHNLTINELGFATDTISGGRTTSAELTATQSGTFIMFCSVGGHRSLGMEGKAEVK